ncbi:MAG: hypothetical protein NVS3B17_16100 [Vulcanimicrobiaceae bacterium]
MEQPIVKLEDQAEAIARYLGSSYPSACISRYEDAQRDVIGFHFLDTTHGDVEFSRQLLQTFPTNENAVALELHLRHASSEIRDTHPGERVVFAMEGCRREHT